MGALRTKKVKVYQYVTNVCEGVVSYEGENYLMMIDDNDLPLTRIYHDYNNNNSKVLNSKE